LWTQTIDEQLKPIPNAGEVLVQLKMTAVIPSDVKMHMGVSPNLLYTGLVNPHSDGDGVI
jgi:NADPH:quinone reductase-like Zn-dependent oxidoreductase